MSHFYGYKKDHEDPRDFKFSVVRTPDQKFPASIDLRQYCSPVRDQGNLGACTGFATVVGLRESLEIIDPTPTPNPVPPPNPTPVPPDPNPVPSGCLAGFFNLFKVKRNKAKGVSDSQEFVELSPEFLYYQERVIEGTVNEDSGAEIRDGMKALAKTGVCPEADWPYDIANFMNPPSSEANADSSRYMITVYSRLTNALTDLKSCLAGGFGFVLGFNVYDSFESDAVAQTGIMPMPNTTTEQLLGGHAVFCVGYEDDATAPGGGYFLVKNSWGTGWGLAGYFKMPYAFMTDPNQVSDIWTASK